MDLMNAIGDGLLGSDYHSMRNGVRDGVSTAKNLLGLNDTEWRAPSDQSLFGFIPDPVLRRLPPSLAYKAKRFIDMKEYEGLNLVHGFVKNVINEAKAKAAEAAGNIAKKKLGLNDNSLSILGLGRKPQDVPPVAHLKFTKNDKYQESKSGVSGYEVTVCEGNFDPTKKPIEIDASNEVAEMERDNALKFRPREETLWYITLDRYTKSDGNSYYTALPPIPTFINEFAKDEYIEYIKWLPAVDYNYTRRTIHNASQIDYGWGHMFHQISSITRGSSFSITLEDDRVHSFSKYCKEVANRSASYEQASMTYWECLLHKITIVILDKQWRLQEKFTLLGLLQNDGTNRYSSDISGRLSLEFDIVGEITNENDRVIESLL